MSPDPTITPPPIDTPNTLTPEVSRVDSPQVQFSAARWFFTGLVRVLYRFWTRIAANLFPEDSRTEQIALALHIPLPDHLNMSWVTDHLAVGGRIRTGDIKALARMGVTHVVDTRLEHSDDVQALAREHIKLLYLPTPDTQPLTVEQMIEGARWTHEHIKQGARILIHCEHGVGRSVLLTCAVLVYGGMSAHDALHLVQEKRWQAAPNHRQVVRLQEFEATLSEPV